MSNEDSIVQLTAFVVGREEYVVDILRISEIIRPMPITPVRRGAQVCRGSHYHSGEWSFLS